MNNGNDRLRITLNCMFGLRYRDYSGYIISIVRFFLSDNMIYDVYVYAYVALRGHRLGYKLG